MPRLRVTEHRVWHLELLRHGSSGDSGHEGWHVPGRVVGALVRLSTEAGAGTAIGPYRTKRMPDPMPKCRTSCKVTLRSPYELFRQEMSDTGLWAIHLSGPDEHRPLDAVVMTARRTKILRLVRLTEYPLTGLMVSRMNEPPNRYDVTVTVARDAGPSSRSGRVRRGSGAGRIEQERQHTAEQIISVVTVQTADRPAAVAVALAVVSEALRRPAASPSR